MTNLEKEIEEKKDAIQRIYKADQFISITADSENIVVINIGVRDKRTAEILLEGALDRLKSGDN